MKIMCNGDTLCRGFHRGALAALYADSLIKKADELTKESEKFVLLQCVNNGITFRSATDRIRSEAMIPTSPSLNVKEGGEIAVSVEELQGVLRVNKDMNLRLRARSKTAKQEKPVWDNKNDVLPERDTILHISGRSLLPTDPHSFRMGLYAYSSGSLPKVSTIPKNGQHNLTFNGVDLRPLAGVATKLTEKLNDTYVAILCQGGLAYVAFWTHRFAILKEIMPHQIVSYTPDMSCAASLDVFNQLLPVLDFRKDIAVSATDKHFMLESENARFSIARVREPLYCDELLRLLHRPVKTSCLVDGAVLKKHIGCLRSLGASQAKIRFRRSCITLTGIHAKTNKILPSSTFNNSSTMGKDSTVRFNMQGVSQLMNRIGMSDVRIAALEKKGILFQQSNDPTTSYIVMNQ